jgi:hypothetical protein
MLTAEAVQDRLLVMPPAHSVPAGIIQLLTDATAPFSEPLCLRPTEPRKCQLHFVQLAEGGPETILFFDHYAAYWLTQDAAGTWQRTAMLEGPRYCAQAALDAGVFTTTPHLWPDVMIGSHRFWLRPLDEANCGRR